MYFASVFIAGAAIMIIELLGARQLVPYFGNTLFVWGSVITVFMMSLAIGYFLGGYLTTKKNSLRHFGALFIASGLVLFVIIKATSPLLQFIAGLGLDPRYGSLLASFILFGLPIVILGMISPFSVALKTQQGSNSGHVAEKLYAVATLAVQPAPF